MSIWAFQVRKRVRLLPIALTYLFAFVLVSGVVVFSVWFAATASYAHGVARGYNQGVLDGEAATCSALAIQRLWAINTEQTLSASGTSTHAPLDDPVIAAKVRAATEAPFNYTCAHIADPNNIYQPPINGVNPHPNPQNY